MSRYWSPVVERLTPYVPGEQRAAADIVKLNTNENPYPPSPKVMAAIAAVAGQALRRYPSPESDRLREALARYHQVPKECVFVGNGSDEILALAFLAFFSDRGPLQFPVPSYSFYPVYCKLYGIEPQAIALAEDFRLDLAQFTPSLEPDAGGIVFPNPNAPTGLEIAVSAIGDLATRHSGVVLVDEAYADFASESAISLTQECGNVLVSRTFSKGRSLAGLRLGYAIAGDELIDGLRRVKNSFNSYPVDVVAEAAAIASLEDEAAFSDGVRRINKTRERFTFSLEERGYKVLPSAANFVFARPPARNAGELANHLAEQNILVRHWPQSDIDEWLRISIGNDADMGRLLAVLDEYTAS